jgi:hypothetical protein
METLDPATKSRISNSFRGELADGRERLNAVEVPANYRARCRVEAGRKGLIFG